MSNKKLKCSNCKISKIRSDYSNRQASSSAATRRCKICTNQKRTDALKESQFISGKRKIDDELAESHTRLDGSIAKTDQIRQIFFTHKKIKFQNQNFVTVVHANEL